MPTITPTCTTCGNLRNEIANTGRGEYLADAWYKMVRSDLANDIDLGRCPECDACFEWTDHPQCYGSGNLDEEHVRRLPEAEAALVRTLCAPVDIEAPLRVFDAALAIVAPDLLRALLRKLVYQQRPAFQLLLPKLIDQLYLKPGMSDSDSIANYVGWGLGRAREVMDLIEADARPRPFIVEHLHKRCREVKP